MKWRCEYKLCQKPSLRSVHAQCELCHLHFCVDHVGSRFHPCYTPEEINSIQSSQKPGMVEDLNSRRREAGERVISRLLSTINHEALCSRATGLRDGMKCKVDLPVAQTAYFNFDILGGCNYHGSIVFEDGKTWLARFRLPNHNAPPIGERNFDRRSEFATYTFLAGTGIQVPQVYDVADDDDPLNPVGAGYILLEKLPGKPMEWHEASESQKLNFSRQLADVYIRLAQHPFDKLGRLQLSSQHVPEVGSAFFNYSATGEPTRMGPYSQSNDYYRDLVQRQILLLKTHEIIAPIYDEVYFMYMCLLEDLPQSETRPFFLRHIDSRDANFLVDDDYNITGIIDWELAMTTSKSAAFQSPLLMYNLEDLYSNGVSTPCEDENRLASILRGDKGVSDLAITAVKKLHLRVELLLEEDPYDRDRFIQLFIGWWKLAKGEDNFEWNLWYEEAKQKYGLIT